MPRPGGGVGGGVPWGGFGMARQFWLFCRRPAPSVEGRGLRAKIGAMMNSDERIERSRLLYERALFDGEGRELALSEGAGHLHKAIGGVRGEEKHPGRTEPA